jgi:hypothetical protein
VAWDDAARPGSGGALPPVAPPVGPSCPHPTVADHSALTPGPSDIRQTTVDRAMWTVGGVPIAGIHSRTTAWHGRNVTVDSEIVTSQSVGDTESRASTWCAAERAGDAEGVRREVVGHCVHVALTGTGVRAGRTDSVDDAPQGPLSVLPTTPTGPHATPRAFGYVSVPHHVARDDLEEAHVHAGRHLAAQAECEGLTLAGVFTDVRGRSEQGFYALMTAVREHGAVAVVVPGLDHLRQIGCFTGADARTMSRYLHARLIVARPETLVSWPGVTPAGIGSLHGHGRHSHGQVSPVGKTSIRVSAEGEMR